MKYAGSCHCKQAMIFCECELKQPIVCNSSYYSKRNTILDIVDDIKVYENQKEQAYYRFNKMKGSDYFCKYCGIFACCTPPEPIYPYCISICIFDEYEWKHLPLLHFDGKSVPALQKIKGLSL